MTDHVSPASAVVSAPAPEKAPSRRAALFVVFLVVFIDLFGFGIVFPLLPRYAEEFLDPLIPGGKEARLGGLILGLLMASFSAMQFLFAPLWGAASDRHGRRPILLLGLLGSVVFYGLFALASELGTEGWRLVGLILLFVSRLGAGTAGATIGTAHAAIADCTTPENRSGGMALIGVAYGLGFTFGPLLGAAALLLAPDFRAGPGLMATGCSLAALLLGLVLLPETFQPGGEISHGGLLDWQSLKRALRRPSVGLLIVTFFIATFAFAGFEATLSLLTRDALNFDESVNFLLYSYVGIVLMFSQGGLYQLLTRRFHVEEIPLILTGVLLMGLGITGLGGTAALVQWTEDLNRTSLVGGFLAALAMVSVGFAFLIPSVQSLLSRRTDLSQQGEIMGVNQSAAALARIVGPVVGLSLYRLPPNHVLPNALGTVLMIAVVLLTFRARRS